MEDSIKLGLEVFGQHLGSSHPVGLSQVRRIAILEPPLHHCVGGIEVYGLKPWNIKIVGLETPLRVHVELLGNPLASGEVHAVAEEMNRRRQPEGIFLHAALKAVSDRTSRRLSFKYLKALRINSFPYFRGSSMPYRSEQLAVQGFLRRDDLVPREGKLQGACPLSGVRRDLPR